MTDRSSSRVAGAASAGKPGRRPGPAERLCLSPRSGAATVRPTRRRHPGPALPVTPANRVWQEYEQAVIAFQDRRTTLNLMSTVTVYFGTGLGHHTRARAVAQFLNKQGRALDSAYQNLNNLLSATRSMATTGSTTSTTIDTSTPNTSIPAGKVGVQPVRVIRSSTGVRHLWVGLEPDQALAENVKVSANTLVVHAHGKNGAMSADPAKLKEEIAAARLAGVDEVLLCV